MSDQDRLAEHNRTVLARIKCSEFGWDGKDCRSELPVVFADWCRHCLMQEVAYRTQENARLKDFVEQVRLRLDASEPRSRKGGQTVGPRAEDWHMTPTTRHNLRRLLESVAAPSA